MTKTLSTVTTLELLPENLREDQDIIAASKSLDKRDQLILNFVTNLNILPRVDELSDELLDHVAYFFHVDFYDQSFEREVKIELINESIYLHRIKGTPRAVELLVEKLFGQGIVEEWYEYGGEPYTFRVITNNPEVTQERAAEFVRAVNTVKNARSHLDSVILQQREEMDLLFAAVVHEGSKETYSQ
ncbi:phage tail protein I [Paenalkalicoccus suaedae]|uniref:Phage tail protein I n=1 Tax=Paenalkalicoccus suaedae TaxID=2592382 RepID=A0A859FDE1_9BACI|nr:phage tail protein I [Paenalkalicoccus suaedae]QKS70265.1 phage tail protein I [Paenalkalicoccus suaedae]